jgi:hypothetical protein
VEETGVFRENHRPVANLRQTLSHNVISSTPRHEWGSNSQLFGKSSNCLLQGGLKTKWINHDDAPLVDCMYKMLHVYVSYLLCPTVHLCYISPYKITVMIECITMNWDQCRDIKYDTLTQNSIQWKWEIIGYFRKLLWTSHPPYCYAYNIRTWLPTKKKKNKQNKHDIA